VSWQIIPEGTIELVSDPDSKASQRAIRTMLTMEKLDIRAIRAAYEGDDGSG
jgi:predicted 3-demethylubiquinone-9 3-methyltransferase (glyoxalase superfamily)